MKFIDLGAQRAKIRERVDERIAAVMAHGQYILGPEVAELEEELARRAGVSHCIGVANGTDALQLALMALGVGPGDEVITPSFSYVAAAEVIVLLGATPVFVDIDPVSFNVDPTAVESALTERTKAIIPVDLFGQCADYEAIAAAADARGVPIIEDGAQSFGAARAGRPACSFGRVATTSFFPTKPLGCYGDGGACFTDDDELAASIRSLRAHGQARRYHHVRLGVNARLDTLQAAVLLAKLEVFDDEVVARQRAAMRYAELFHEARLADLNIEAPRLAPGNTGVWAQYTIRARGRERLIAQMTQAGVPTMVHYPLPLHDQEVFVGRHRRSGTLEHSTKAAEEVMSLPMHPYLLEEDQRRVVTALASAVTAAA
jgi:UDP-2-acetamido-2-deoxy-ribo-hexuluronate aminotransferase